MARLGILMTGCVLLLLGGWALFGAPDQGSGEGPDRSHGSAVEGREEARGALGGPPGTNTGTVQGVEGVISDAGQRVAAEAAQVGGPAAEISASHAAAATDAAQDTRVLFEIDPSATTGDSASVAALLVVPTEGGNGEMRNVPWDGEGVSVRLGPGGYRAALTTGNGQIGPVVEFRVETQTARIVVPPPGHLKLTMTCASDGTQKPLAGVMLKCRRVDVSRFEEDEANERTATSDGSGFLALEDLACGVWAFAASADGFAEVEFELDLPGDRTILDQTARTIDLGTMSMPEIRPLTIVLDGYQDWGGATGFRIAHTSEGTQLPFDDDGRAEIPLGWFGEPLMLKLWYPGEQLGVLYLDAGVPGPGEPLVIDVGHDRQLEIDLQIADAAREVVAAGESPLRATFRTARGDSMMCGFPVEGEGQYVILGVHGERTTASFATMVDGQYTELATESVLMDGRGGAACTLVVNGPPRVLRLLDEGGQALGGLYVEIREVPDTTSWLSGGATDEQGRIAVPDTRALRYSLRALDETRRLMMVDKVVELAAGSATTDVTLVFGAPAHLLVLLDGEPAPGVPVELFGEQSTSPIWTEETSDGGTTEPWRMTSGSSPVARAIAHGLWTPAASVALSEGENRLEFYSMGTIECFPGVRLTGITHQALETTLQEWIDAGLVQPQPGFTHRAFGVPAGRYTMEHQDGSREEFELASGGSAVVRPYTVEHK